MPCVDSPELAHLITEGLSPLITSSYFLTNIYPFSAYMDLNFYIQERKTGQSVVICACNPAYSVDRDWENHSLRSFQAKKKKKRLVRPPLNQQARHVDPCL
jgi:hypothetical protein